MLLFNSIIMFDKYYKIIPISHLMKNKEFGKAGEIHKGDKFINLADSVAGGFCVEATEEELENAGIGFEVEEIDLAELDKNELIAYAKENDLTLPENKKAKKGEILEHILSQLETE